MPKLAFGSAALLAATLTTAYAQTPGGAAPADHYPGVPPASAYQGGAGSPFSPRASNIDPTDTRSRIAPRLPGPQSASDNARAYLMAAQRALAHRQTGAAQEALERAQTRILTRSTDPALADRPDRNGMVQAIADARLALGQNDVARAQSIIGQALAAR